MLRFQVKPAVTQRAVLSRKVSSYIMCYQRQLLHIDMCYKGKPAITHTAVSSRKQRKPAATHREVLSKKSSSYTYSCVIKENQLFYIELCYQGKPAVTIHLCYQGKLDVRHRAVLSRKSSYYTQSCVTKERQLLHIE